MKKLFFILFLITLLAPSAFSQTEQALRRAITLGNKKVVPGTFTGNRTISRVLSKRVQTSFERASVVQQHFPDLRLKAYVPSKSTSQFTMAKPQDIYPEATFLTTQKQLSDYFLAQNNRAFIDIYPKLQESQKQILLHEEKLQSQKITPQHPQENDMSWLAQQLTSNIRYFFIGETHGHPEIQEAIANLLREVRRQFPQQKIFLFTEFLLDGQVLPQENPVIPLKKYIPVWETALQEQITPVGLEPVALGPSPKEAQLTYQSKDGFLGMSTAHKSTIRGSLEGMRLRNRHWQTVLDRYRQEYPDALFIIYAGAWHVEYNHPYAVSTALNLDPAEAFEVSLYPSVNLNSFDCNTLTSTLDKITGGRFPERVLKFEDPDLTRLIGFDVQIKIPVFPKED